ncbi:MAG TPA: hypothetical protein VGN72_00995 [Tepidisphaeraceae bacterium]|jgi:hypothetical protein|nr:hypothetical protein [Tepidisphaeraceae bacterium]
MSKSFYTGTYEALRAGSANFAALISATPTAFGLTADDAASYALLDAAYQTAWSVADSPNTRTSAAIVGRNDSAIPLRAMAVTLTNKINGTPTVTNEQKTTLGLSVRATPSPAPAPGMPIDFSCTLNGGALDLKWKCNNNPRGSRGVMYQVWRSIDGGPDVYLGGSGSKQFVDNTLPAGSSTVTYKVQAVRTTAMGPWAYYVVQLGMNGGNATVSDVTTPKIAA